MLDITDGAVGDVNSPNVYNVKAYGATGDGATDDTTNIALAFTAAGTTGVVYFPPGTYIVSAQLVSATTCKVLGAGHEMVTLDVATSFTGVLFDIAERSEISHIKIEGDDQDHAFDAINSTATYNYSCRLTNLRFKWVGDYCIELDQSWGTSIRDVHCLDVGGGVRLLKWNGGSIENLYTNGIKTGHSLNIRDSRGWTVDSLVTEDIDGASIYHIYLQGCESGVINGWYCEGDATATSSDLVISSATGIGPTENITIQGTWMNSNPVALRVAPILISSAENILLKDFHWHTPVGAYTPYFIDTKIGSDNHVIQCENWTVENTTLVGTTTIPLGDNNNYILYRSVNNTNGIPDPFASTPDAGGRLPMVWQDDPINKRFEIGNGNLEVYDETDLGSESLTNGELTAGTSWTDVNDCTLAGNVATWTYSAGDATLTQAKGTLAVVGAGDRWYEFVYTISSMAGDNIPTATITTSFAAVAVILPLDNGTHTIIFKATDAPRDFVISSTLAANDTFVMDALSLKEVQGGDVRAHGSVMSDGGWLALKTLIWTIDLNASGTADDYEFDNTAANQTEQVITIANGLPAYAELVSAQLRCFETVTGSTAMSIDVGTASGGNEILAAVNTDTANDINSTGAGDGPELLATNAVRSVYVNATPASDWDGLSAGRWAIMISYIDYGKVYTQRNP
ncbi:MAG: hypothetical protein JRC86_05275 [Deltaproteobacteria bacterium]|nr:hypothetical protein [Deltaproteobacteria bacterium]